MSIIYAAIAAVIAYLLWRYFIRPLVLATRVIRRTANTLGDARAEADRLSTLPMAEFLEEWMKLAKQVSAACRRPEPRLRLPVNAEQFSLAEERLVAPLPPEIKEFYAATDGIDWSAVEYKRNVVVLSELKPSCMYQPPLSAQARAAWDEHGKAAGDPEGLPVTSTDLVKIATNDYEVVLPFTDVDAMLALEPVESARCTVIVYRPHPFYPIGTVLEVENFCATRYDSIKAWLASSEAALASIAKIRKSS